MSETNIRVAVLFATYNGASFVDEQIRSLSANKTPFTLCWVDDRSTDATPDLVRKAALIANVRLREIQCPERLGVPRVFFELMDQVEAEIYLFCDQDDIWQPGKIDATVQSLLPFAEEPALCFSDPLMFRDGERECTYRLSVVGGATPSRTLSESRVFMAAIPHGHTQGFTRPLRDLVMRHKEIACSHAISHDVWVYGVAVAAGSAMFLSNVPTTLYRTHGHNVSDAYGSWRGRGVGYVTVSWSQHQRLRRRIARHAAGFILASKTLPTSIRVSRLVDVARSVASLDRRQSIASIIRILRQDALWANRLRAAVLAAICVLSDA